LIKLLEQSINKYSILWIPYKNIFYYLCNDINFVLHLNDF
jgi:hypothetical protein